MRVMLDDSKVARRRCASSFTEVDRRFGQAFQPCNTLRRMSCRPPPQPSGGTGSACDRALGDTSCPLARQRCARARIRYEFWPCPSAVRRLAFPGRPASDRTRRSGNHTRSQPDWLRKVSVFPIPALLRRGCTFVVSPLETLVSDQVSGLLRKKIPATFVNSALSVEEKEVRYDMVRVNAVKFLYLPSERFVVKSRDSALLLRRLLSRQGRSQGSAS